MLALNKTFQHFYMLAAQDHFQPHPDKKSWSQRFMNLILVDRKASVIQIRRLVKECEQARDQNKILIIYPEGTRSVHQALQSFKSGTVYLAYKLNLPIIPAAIKGTGEALPKNSWFIRPKPITVRFGEPILPEQIEGLSSKQAIKNLTAKLEASVNALLAS